MPLLNYYVIAATACGIGLTRMLWLQTRTVQQKFSRMEAGDAAFDALCQKWNWARTQEAEAKQTIEWCKSDSEKLLAQKGVTERSGAAFSGRLHPRVA